MNGKVFPFSKVLLNFLLWWLKVYVVQDFYCLGKVYCKVFYYFEAIFNRIVSLISFSVVYIGIRKVYRKVSRQIGRCIGRPLGFLC